MASVSYVRHSRLRVVVREVGGVEAGGGGGGGRLVLSMLGEGGKKHRSSAAVQVVRPRSVKGAHLSYTCWL